MKGKRKRQKAHGSNGSFVIKSRPNKGALQQCSYFQRKSKFSENLVDYVKYRFP